MAEEYDFGERTNAEVLLSYANYRGKLNRASGKIDTSMALLSASFSSQTAKNIQKELDKCDRWVDIMSQIADWMVSQKMESAKDHVTEVAGMAKTLAKGTDNYLQLMHMHTQGGNVTIDSDDESVHRGASAKPVSELRPKELAYDATPSAVRDWKVKFRAYHDASNMRALPLSTQRAFMINTVATEISKRITRLTTETTPIFPTDRQESCFDYIDAFFREKIPLIHRRKAFFTYVQQEGQDATQLREELRNLADLGDIAGLDLPGALMLMYTMSIRDVKLQEKLMAVTEPTLEKFNTIMDAHVQMQNGLKEFNKQSRASGFKVQGQQGDRNKETGSRPKLSDDEKKRRKLINKKCYRCGSAEHMMPACKMSASITCNTCKAQGHISPVCLKAVARTVSSQPTQPEQNSGQLALTYDPSQSAASSFYAPASAQVFNSAAHNIPTPQLPL